MKKKKKLYHFRVVSNAVIDSYNFPHHANIFLWNLKIHHSSDTYNHWIAISEKRKWKSGYNNLPRNDKKALVSLSYFKTYLTTKLHMVWSVNKLVCKRLRERNGLSMLNWKQDIIIIFQGTLFISTIKYT